MIIIIKVDLDDKFLGFEFKDWIDEQQFKINSVYDDRLILKIDKEEYDQYECIVYKLQLSNKEVEI